MFRVEKEIKFCYGHRLLNYEGRCKNLHGHNGRAILVLETQQLDHRGMVVDFGDIKRHVGVWIDENLDHQTLLHREDPLVGVFEQYQQPTYLMDVNPTAENIAKLIFDRAQTMQLPVCEVRLWETDTSVAVYRPDVYRPSHQALDPTVSATTPAGK